MKILDLFKKNNNFVKPYIIAEAGVNHECNMQKAFKLIKNAKDGGADAIKFQTYKADELASKFSPAYWDLKKEKTKNQNELFKKYDKFDENHYKILKKYCDKIKIEFLSTPFDFNSARFLSKLVKCYKISSSDITNKPFIKYLCKFRKPIILSTGASNMDEIRRAVKWIEEEKIKVAILHCVLNYPTDDVNANLNMIVSLIKSFPKNIIGYSDHTLPKDMFNLVAATTLGAKIIEKHFTLDKKLKGNDHYHSMDQTDLARLRNRLDLADSMINESYSESEFLRSQDSAIKNARRSLYYSRDIDEGSIIQKDDFIPKRPGTGLEVKFYSSLVGKKLKVDVKSDDIVDLSHYQPI